MMSRRLNSPRSSAPRGGFLLFDLLPELSIVAIGSLGIVLALTVAGQLFTPESDADSWETVNAASEGEAATPVFDFATAPEGRVLVSQEFGKVGLHAAPGTARSAVLSSGVGPDGDPRRVFRLASSPVRSGSALGGADDGSVLLWESVDDVDADPVVLGRHAGHVTSIAMSRDGAWGASAGADRSVTLWRLDGHERIRSFRAEKDVARTLDFSPDGDLLAWGERDGVSFVRLAEVESQSPQRIEGLSPDVACVAFSPDSRLLAVGHFTGALSLCDVEKKSVRWSTRDDVGMILSVGFDMKGNCVLGGRLSGTLATVDLGSGEFLGAIPMHRGGVRQLVTLPDGETLLTGGYDGRVRRWRLGDLSELP